MKADTLGLVEVSAAVRKEGVTVVDVMKPDVWVGEVFGSLIVF